jgi:hypothetical protein
MLMLKSKWLIFFLLCSMAGLMSFFIPQATIQPTYYHHPDSIPYLRKSAMMPLGPNDYFLNSFRCGGCHGPDSMNTTNINESGEDVNLYTRWQASMMGLSAKDPLWRAKVSHEITINPSHAVALQDKCVSCHAPMGKYTSLFRGTPHYGLNDLVGDTLGEDGVSCATCHTLSPNGVGLNFSGNLDFDTTQVIYGPFVNPFTGPMQLYEGYTPMFSQHIKESATCSPCHTLITKTVDLAGNFTGQEFVEQATFHEYKNSDFPALGITCQNCHMARLGDPIVIANGIIGLPARSPFNQHSFAGANTFMLNLIKANKNSLGINIPDFRFDTTIIASYDMLQNRSIDLDLMVDSLTADTVYFRVKILNKAGHKFPSGYPARRAVVQFVVLDAQNDTVFKSGIFNNEFKVKGENTNFEPHHQIINQSNTSQIYEMSPGDVNNQFTSVLERAAVILKDNRIPPTGFLTSTPIFDTVRISNDALNDMDFNQTGIAEGTGTDYIHYHIPVSGLSGNLKVRTKVFYQSVPPKWVGEMFALNTPEIDTFKTMFQNADQTPVLVASDSLVNLQLVTGGKASDRNDWSIGPTPSSDGRVIIKAPLGTIISHLELFASDGRRVLIKRLNPGEILFEVTLPEAKGYYFLKVFTTKGNIFKKLYRS